MVATAMKMISLLTETGSSLGILVKALKNYAGLTDSAQSDCSNLQIAGRIGWRLSELDSVKSHLSLNL